MSRQSGPSPSNEAPLNSFTGSWRFPSGEPAARTGRFRFGRPARGMRVARNKRKTEPADRTGRFVSGGRRPKQEKKGPWRSLRFGPSTKPAPGHGVLPGAAGTYGMPWEIMAVNGFLRIIMARRGVAHNSFFP